MVTKSKIHIWFLTPTVLFYVIILIIPVLWVSILSLFQYSYVNDFPFKFVGLQNFTTALADANFRSSVWFSLRFSVASTILTLSLGMGVALLLQNVGKIRRFYTSVLLLPTIMMPIAVGYVWRYMYNHDYGLICWFLKGIGLLGSNPLLVNPDTVFWSLIFTDVWEWTPFVTIVLLAGLDSLPLEPYESAMVDGANQWQMFSRITLPLLIPVFLVVALIRVIDSIKIFDIILVLTNGGPGVLTESVNYFSYKINFKTFDMGYGGAVVFLLQALILVICYILYKVIIDRNKEVD